jgi:hypothetical protein
MSTLFDEIELLALPVGTVIAGPSWHDEIYKKFDTETDQWFTTGTEDPWTSRTLIARGPFTILRLGDAE